MTRNSELNCEDLFGCDHSPETPISGHDGTIEGWLCRCGREVAIPDESLLLGQMRVLLSLEHNPWSRIGLVFVRDLIASTHTQKHPCEFKATLTSLAIDRLIELRSWSGLASEVTDILDFCPIAPDGTALAIIRVIAT